MTLKATDTLKGIWFGLGFFVCIYNDIKDGFLPAPALGIVSESAIIPSNKTNCTN